LQQFGWNDERGFAMLHLRLDLLALAAVSGCGIGFFVWTVCLLLTNPQPSRSLPAQVSEQVQ
jgi:hypothetical protein